MDEQYADATIQMPEQASTLAPQIDSTVHLEANQANGSLESEGDPLPRPP